MTKKIMIIGAGPAGVSVVETLRAHDRESTITMLSAEPYLPYSPPAMADHFINGSSAHLWRDVTWLGEMRVDYRSGVLVKSIDTAKHQISLVTGEGSNQAPPSSLGYNQLVIATGSRLYAPLPGAELPEVYNFKSLSAAEALVQRVKSGQARSAVIVGAGFIGMEIALLLQILGVTVIQLEMTDQVMPAMLDSDSAAFALKMMRQRGVDVHLNTQANAILGDRQAEGVQLASGEVLRADLYIAATGVRPNLELLSGSNIAHGWGITVDDHLRTSMADIYAAGDVVETRNRFTGEIAVHAIFPNAVEQGRVVGLNLVGIDTLYAGAERMNSLKHLGLPLLAAGVKHGDEVLQAHYNGNLRTLYLQDNRLVGYQLVGDVRPAGAFRALLLRGEHLGRFKDHLLERNFGQGKLVWGLMN